MPEADQYEARAVPAVAALPGQHQGFSNGCRQQRHGTTPRHGTKRFAAGCGSCGSG